MRAPSSGETSEIYLLNDQILDILIVDTGAPQGIATGELTLKTQCVDYRNDTVKTGHSHLQGGIIHAAHGADSLGDRSGLAYTAGLDNDVVEHTGRDKFGQLADEVHFQCTADAAVLQRHEIVRLPLAYYAFLADKGFVDIDLAYVVDNHGGPDTAGYC